MRPGVSTPYKIATLEKVCGRTSLSCFIVSVDDDGRFFEKNLYSQFNLITFRKVKNSTTISIFLQSFATESKFLTALLYKGYSITN